MVDEAGTTTTETTTGAAASVAGTAADAGTTGAATADAGAAADAAKTADATEAAAREAEKQLLLKAPEPIDYAKAVAEAKLPDGMALDPALAKTGTDLFAKHNLSAEAARDLVSLYAQQQKAGADGNAKAFATQVDGWKAAAEKATTAEERGSAKEAALKVFGKDELAVMEAFGLTNRAGFIKALAKVSTAIKDDSFVPGNAGALNGTKDARSMFPKSNMNP